MFAAAGRHNGIMRWPGSVGISGRRSRVPLTTSLRWYHDRRAAHSHHERGSFFSHASDALDAEQARARHTSHHSHRDFHRRSNKFRRFQKGGVVDFGEQHHHSRRSGSTDTPANEGGIHDPQFTSFRYVDAAAVSSTFQHPVIAFLRRQGQGFMEPAVIPAQGVQDDDDDPHGNKKLAILVFEVTTGKKVRAVGKASRKETAIALCYMHAQELIDHHTTTNPTATNGSASAVPTTKNGEDEESSEDVEPLPLAVKETTLGMKVVSAPLRPRFASVSGRDDAPQSRPVRTPAAHIDAWKSYIAAVEVFLDARRQQRTAQAFQTHRVPFDLGSPSGSTHPIQEAASERMASWRGMDPSAVTSLHNAYVSMKMPLPDVTCVRAYGATVASIVMDPAENITAVGVGRNKKDARIRCAMMALEILKIRQTLDTEYCGRDAANGCAVNTNAPVFDALRSMSSAQQRLFETYLACTGQHVVTRFRKEQREGSAASRKFVCTFELGEFSCEGHGVNRFEAERAAALIAIEDLLQFDPTFVAVANYLKRQPDFDPQRLQKLQIPQETLEDLRAKVVACYQGFLAANQHSAAASVNAASVADSLMNLSDALIADKSSILGAKQATGVPQQAPAGALSDTQRVASTGELPSILTTVDADARKIVDVITLRLQRERATNGGGKGVAERMREDLQLLRKNAVYLAKFHPRRSSLPMASIQQRVVDTVRAHQVTILCGTTGCGKTTQVPQYILDSEIEEGRGDRCCIVVSQPRRISTYSIAERIAAERLQQVGGEVGYSVRLDSKPGTHITLCTTGILLQMFLGNASMDHISHIIIDEVHERDLNCDVALALCKELIQMRNKAIKIIVMSATLDADKFSAYFNGAPVIQIEGQAYPVQELYLEDVEAVARKQNFFSKHFDDMLRQRDRVRSSLRLGTAMVPPKIDYDLIAFAVDVSINSFNDAQRSLKSVLVFVPGWKELLATKAAVERARPHDAHIILLHSTIDAASQRKCFEPAPAGKVKIVLATNIAESGITIDDAAAVIDTGLIKLTSDSLLASSASDSSTEQSATQLSLTYAGKANCQQRRGRAGRTQGGVCIRLFSRDVWETLPPFLKPEILRTPLEQVVLRLLAMGYSDPQAILAKFVDPPAPAAVDRAVSNLRSLEAMTQHDGKLTPLGLYLSLLPCEPRVGKMMVLGALMNCLDTVLTLSAANDVNPFISKRELARDVRKQRFLFARRTQSDHVALVNVYNSFVANDGSRSYANDHLLSYQNLTLISKYKQQFHDILLQVGLVQRDRKAPSSGKSQWYVDRSPASALWNSVEMVSACLSAGLYPQIAQLDATGSQDDRGSRRKVSKKALAMRLRNGMVLHPSKESACRRADRPAQGGAGDDWDSAPSSYLFMYQGVFQISEARQTFLTNVSAVSPWALLLFAVPAHELRYDSLLSLLTVGNWVTLTIPVETLNVVLAAKKLLSLAMLVKYKDPTSKVSEHILSQVRDICSVLLHQPVELVSLKHVVRHDASAAACDIVAPWASKDEIQNSEKKAMADDSGLDEDDD